MRAKQDIFLELLRHACRFTGAEWAVYAARLVNDWDVILTIGLQDEAVENVTTFINRGRIKRWLDSLAGKKGGGYRSLGKGGKALGAGRMHAFKAGSSKRLLLVGVDDLSDDDRGYFESLATMAPKSVHDMDLLSDPPVLDFEGTSLSLELTDSLHNILESFCAVINPDHGFLALREGDEFFVKAVVGLPDEVLEQQFNLPDQGDFEGVDRKAYAIWNKGLPVEIFELEQMLPKVGWAFVPLVIGQRMIGGVFFGRKAAFDEEAIKEAVIIGQHISLPVEKNIL
ncbi:MAG TPA: hypothetical protein VJ965_09340, partial [Anaerolineales bacterium]|nr:hypothetical protein [Anaerolineales bacterium]